MYPDACKRNIVREETRSGWQSSRVYSAWETRRGRGLLKQCVPKCLAHRALFGRRRVRLRSFG
jgi:hypothetical protein